MTDLNYLFQLFAELQNAVASRLLTKWHMKISDDEQNHMGNKVAQGMQVRYVLNNFPRLRAHESKVSK